MIWYYAKNGQQYGPVDPAHLKELATTAQLSPTDLVWRAGFSHWAPASKVHGLFDGILTPPPLPIDAHKFSAPPPLSDVSSDIHQARNSASPPDGMQQSYRRFAFWIVLTAILMCFEYRWPYVLGSAAVLLAVVGYWVKSRTGGL